MFDYQKWLGSIEKVEFGSIRAQSDFEMHLESDLPLMVWGIDRAMHDTPYLIYGFTMRRAVMDGIIPEQRMRDIAFIFEGYRELQRLCRAVEIALGVCEMPIFYRLEGFEY